MYAYKLPKCIYIYKQFSFWIGWIIDIWRHVCTYIHSAHNKQCTFKFAQTMCMSIAHWHVYGICTCTWYQQYFTDSPWSGAEANSVEEVAPMVSLCESEMLLLGVEKQHFAAKFDPFWKSIQLLTVLKQVVSISIVLPQRAVATSTQQTIACCRDVVPDLDCVSVLRTKIHHSYDNQIWLT